MSDEKDLGSRVYVIEAKQEEQERRQLQQEERQRVQEDLTNTIASNTAVMNNTLSMLMDQVLPKVAEMERQVVKNTTITKASMWLAGTVITAAITAIVAMI